MIDVEYIKLGNKILREGAYRTTRNGTTKGLFGETLVHDMKDGLPLISIRKIYLKGIVGEFKSFLEDAQTLAEFEANGCPYWKLWADEKGDLKLDYPPRGQLDYIIDLLKNDPTSRRMIISLWNPENIGKLSLEPCHTQYQFYVRDDMYIDMIWTQRSVDYAVGMPSDLVLAALYLITLANETGYEPGRITYSLGDVHLYEEHLTDFAALMNRTPSMFPVDYNCIATTKDFDRHSLRIRNYEPLVPMKFKLKD